MPDVSFDAEQVQSQNSNQNDSDCDAVCIDAARIYDSCGAKDCLRDLPVMFKCEDQDIVENACSCKVCKVSVITSTVNVDPVAFHRGFYSVDMVFYFAVTCEVYSTAASLPTTITGLATYAKRVVLYGSDGCVKTFSSEESGMNCSCPEDECNCCHRENVPKATVQISDPMALSAKIKCQMSHGCQNMCNNHCNTVPACVAAFLVNLLFIREITLLLLLLVFLQLHSSFAMCSCLFLLMITVFLAKNALQKQMTHVRLSVRLSSRQIASSRLTQIVIPVITSRIASTVIVTANKSNKNGVFMAPFLYFYVISF